MRSVPITSSPFLYWQALIYTEAALGADERTAHLVGPIRELIQEFERVLAIDRLTRRVREQAFARASVADASIDSVIRDIQSAVPIASSETMLGEASATQRA